MSPKYHILYKTTCASNGKIYVGVHSTKNINDGYLGCGLYRSWKLPLLKTPFQFAVSKYGINDFITEVMGHYDSREDALLAEREIVNEDFILSDRTYNVALGGASPVKLNKVLKYKDEINRLFQAGRSIKSISKLFKAHEITVSHVVENANLTPEIKHKRRINDLIRQRGVCGFRVIVNKLKTQPQERVCREYKISPKVTREFVKRFEPEKFIGVSPEGTIHEFTNVSDFAAEINISKSTIRTTINGNYQQGKGWLFKKAKDWDGSKDILRAFKSHHTGTKLKSPNGDVEQVDTNLSDFCKKHDLWFPHMSKLLLGKKRTYKGWEVIQ